MNVKKFLLMAAAALLPILGLALKAWAEDAEIPHEDKQTPTDVNPY